MSCLVLSYPELSAANYNWIQGLRAKYDQLQYNVVGPHFTFVFSVSNLEQETFVAHVKDQITNYLFRDHVLSPA